MNASTAQEAEHLLLLFSWRPKMRVRVNLKLINRAYSDCYTASRSQERTFFNKKKRLRQCITHTHTQGLNIPGTPFFQQKKEPAAVHNTHTGLKNPRNVIFSGKKTPAAVHHTHTRHKTPRNVIFSKKTSACGSVSHTHRAYKSQERHFF